MEIYLAVAILVIILIGLFLLFSSQINRQINALRDRIDNRIESSQSNFFTAQEGLNQTLRNVHQDLGRIFESSRSLLEMSRSFQNILRVPSPRAGLGELLLENIIKEILPSECYAFQYAFRNGKIADAVIIFPEGILPIDSKFPLESFEKYSSSPDESAKSKYKSQFLVATKKRIDETSKYILPQERTFDFSFMYVPSENIYYQIINEAQILDYANSKKVFMVGPSSFYVYLKTILVGFEGLKIEKESKKILEHIKALEVDIQKIKETSSTLGAHLNNAILRFNELDKKLGELSLKAKYKKNA